MSAAAPPATIVVPTRDRAGYLDVALRSFRPQAADAGAEVIVVVDGYDPESVVVAAAARSARDRARRAARTERRAQRRLEGRRRRAGDLRRRRRRGAAHVAALAARGGRGDARARRLRRADPRRHRRRRAARSCGRDTPPITTLDHGAADVDVARRLEREPRDPQSRARDGRRLRRVDPGRRRRRGGVAGALPLDRRPASATSPPQDWSTAASGPDATLRALARAQYHRGRAARRQDVRKGVAPSLAGELRARRRLRRAHARARLPQRRHAHRPRARPHAGGAARDRAPHAGRRRSDATGHRRTGRPAGPTDWASGESGIVGGVRLGVRTRVEDALLDARRWATLEPLAPARAPRAKRRRAAACSRSGSSARTART